MRRTRKILLGAGVMFGVLVVLLVLVVVLLPKVINIDAVRTGIERTVSKDLGGTATYDRLDLVFFPQPEIEFRDLKIEVPGTASVSVAVVGISAQFLPLLQGRFAVSSVVLDRPALTLVLPDAAAKSRIRPSPKAKPESLTVGAVLTVLGRAMPDLSLKISRGRLSMMRTGQTVLSFDELDAALAFVPDDQEAQGPAGGSPPEYYRVTGSARAVVTGKTAFPAPLRISIERFDAMPERLAVTKSRARLLDMDAALRGSVEGYLSAAPTTDITASGTIGPNAAAWIRNLAGIPGDMMVHAPLKVTAARLHSSGTGSASSRELTGSIAVQDGPTISFDLRQEPGLFSLKKLQVKDSESDALLTGTVGEKDLDLAFTGTLTGATLSRIIDREQMPFKRIAGNVRMLLPRDRWNESTADGTLEAEGVMISSSLTGPFVVDRFSVQARGRTVDLHPVVLSLGPDTLTAEGTASLSGKGVTLDLDVSAERITVASLREFAKGGKAEGDKTSTPSADKELTVEGDLRLRAAAVVVNRYTADDVSLVLSFRKGLTTADLEHASLCGIDLEGTLRTHDHELELTLRPNARGRQLDGDLRCLFPEDVLVTGSYDLSGSLTGRGPWDTLLQSLQGNFDFSAKQGRIQSERVVRGVIAYLNSTSLLKGSRSDLLQEGVPYEAITFRGTVHDGVISLKEGIIKSKEIHITADGDLDLNKDTLALNVLVAPFTTTDRLLSKIPIVKYIAGSALIVVPVRVEGALRSPKVKPLPASGVGTNISNLMKNIVQTPVKIVDPILPEDRDTEPKPAKGQR